jgi:hypothetical protein
MKDDEIIKLDEVEFDIDGLHALKIYRNKYGLFKIDSKHSNKYDYDISYFFSLSKWQNGWEPVYTCSFCYEPGGYIWENSKLTPRHQKEVNKLKKKNIREMIKWSEMMFAPHDRVAKNVDGNIVSVLKRLILGMARGRGTRRFL